MMKRIRRKIACVVTGCMMLCLCGFTSIPVNAAVDDENDYLYYLRAKQAEVYMNSESDAQADEDDGEGIEPAIVLSAGAPSVCVGSACAGSVCLGSACAASTCIISGCLGSICLLCG